MSLEKRRRLLHEVCDKAQEAYEFQGGINPHYLVHLLANLVLIEREEKEYLRKCLNENCRRT